MDLVERHLVAAGDDWVCCLLHRGPPVVGVAAVELGQDADNSSNVSHCGTQTKRLVLFLVGLPKSRGRSITTGRKRLKRSASRVGKWKGHDSERVGTWRAEDDVLRPALHALGVAGRHGLDVIGDASGAALLSQHVLPGERATRMRDLQRLSPTRPERFELPIFGSVDHLQA
jgi:hypothetical protein